VYNQRRNSPAKANINVAAFMARLKSLLKKQAFSKNMQKIPQWLKPPLILLAYTGTEVPAYRPNEFSASCKVVS
jgi:hypothetical protein